jgi:hypothetical protein
VQSLSWIAPLTPVVKVTRALVNGVFPLELVPALAIILGLTLLFLATSLRTMRRRLIV